MEDDVLQEVRFAYQGNESKNFQDGTTGSADQPIGYIEINGDALKLATAKERDGVVC